VIRRVAGAVFPVGSARRSQLARAARNIGLLPAGKLSEYERWINTVEPWQFSSATPHDVGAVAHLPFHIEIRIGGATPAEVERTVISLGDQSHANWTARFTGLNPGLTPTLARLRLRESRVMEDPDGSAQFCAMIDAGDVLAPGALFEVARVITPTVLVVTGDHDSLNQFGDRRTNPRRHVGGDIDALRQFDPLSGLVIRRTSLVASEILPTVLASVDTSTGTQNTYVHVGNILLHRRYVPGAIQRVLPGTDPATVRTVTSGAIVHAGAPDFGTQVRDRHYGSMPTRVGVIVVGNSTTRQRADLSASIARANAMFESMTVNVSVVLSDVGLPAFPPATEVVRALESQHATIGLIIDGSLRIQSPDLFADLIGIVCRNNVFGVAPIVVSPSGVALDAGLDLTSGDAPHDEILVARCGPLKRPPYALLWTRSVPALSGRCLFASLKSFRALGNRTVSPTNLRLAAAESGTSLLIWPHHQVVFTYGITPDGNTPAALPWRDPPLMTWFGPNIAPYSPLNDSASESLW
jgi:hypothetical protein